MLRQSRQPFRACRRAARAAGLTRFIARETYVGSAVLVPEVSGRTEVLALANRILGRELVALGNRLQDAAALRGRQRAGEHERPGEHEGPERDLGLAGGPLGGHQADADHRASRTAELESLGCGKLPWPGRPTAVSRIQQTCFSFVATEKTRRSRPSTAATRFTR